MDISQILAELIAERDKLSVAIEALGGAGQNVVRRGPGRPPKSQQPRASAGGNRRTMSASARNRISAAQKARWASQKGNAVSKKVGRPKGRILSPAARKRISEAMKKRWAQRKS